MTTRKTISIEGHPEKIDWYDGPGIQGSITISGTEEVQSLIEERFKAFSDEAQEIIDDHASDRTE